MQLGRICLILNLLVEIFRQGEEHTESLSGMWRTELPQLGQWIGYGSKHNSYVNGLGCAEMLPCWIVFAVARWEPEKNFSKFNGDMIDQFWEKVDLGGRDRTEFKQFDKIGEEFFAARPCTYKILSSLRLLPRDRWRSFNCAAVDNKRKASNSDDSEESQKPPPKAQKTSRKSKARPEPTEPTEDSDWFLFFQWTG